MDEWISPRVFRAPQRRAAQPPPGPALEPARAPAVVLLCCHRRCGRAGAAGAAPSPPGSRELRQTPMRARSARCEKNVRVSRGRTAKNYSDATPNGAYAAEIKQTAADQRNSADRKQSAGEFLQTQRLIRQHPVRKQHSEDWNCCLQNRSQTG